MVVHCICQTTQLFQTDLGEDAARLRLRFKDTQNALPYSSGILACIDAGPDTSLLVVGHDGHCLIVICSQPLLQGFGVIVRSLN